MSELMLYGDDDGLSRRGKKDLERIQDRAAARRVEMESAEDYAAQLANRRIANGYELVNRTAHHAGQLNRTIAVVTRDNPGLEMLIKPIEEEAARCAGYIIYRYMTR